MAARRSSVVQQNQTGRIMSADPHFSYKFIRNLLIPQNEIEKRVTQLGQQITADYQDSERLLLLGLLRGSVIFITESGLRDIDSMPSLTRNSANCG